MLGGEDIICIGLNFEVSSGIAEVTAALSSPHKNQCSLPSRNRCALIGLPNQQGKEAPAFSLQAIAQNEIPQRK